MHRRLGSAILLQLAFPRGKQPKFPMEEIPLGQYSCKKYVKYVLQYYLLNTKERCLWILKLYINFIGTWKQNCVRILNKSE